jgi:transcription elongation factor Elf1
LADSFLIIRDFTSHHLNYEPVELLGEATWTELLTVAEVYEKELKECRSQMASVTWSSPTLENVSKYVRCIKCHAQLVKPTNPQSNPQLLEFQCSACGELFLLDDVVVDLVDDYYGADNYLAASQGGDPATDTCPDCGEETYVLEEDQCVKCGATRSYRNCVLCGEYLSLEEQDLNGLCGYHYHIATKDD